MPGWKTTKPKSDSEYFERLTKTIFTAGLSWQMVENKWPGFRKAFHGFSLEKVSGLTGKDVRRLMSDSSIVRNEKKIAATVYNASEVKKLEKEFGSFGGYLASFGKDEKRLQADLQSRFKHVGPSTARMFLWSVAHPLTPNAEEKKWMAGHS